MRKNISFVLIAIILSTIILSACGGGAGNSTAEEAAIEPTPTATPDPKLDLDVFMDVLTESLATRDFARLQPLIGVPFSLASIGSGSSSLPASDLIKRLEKNMLLESSDPLFLPDADLTPILGDRVPTSLGPGLKVVAILFSKGWGENGVGEAILYISELPDKTFAWYGMVYAREGFDVLVEAEKPQEKMDRTDLESFKMGLVSTLGNPRRSAEMLLPLMADPFILAGWESEGAGLSPDVAIVSLLDMLPAPETVNYNAYPAYAKLLDGQDPQQIFPTGVEFLHMTVWGADGAGEAILIIGQNAEGLYTWAGVLNAPAGFQR
ncbi:MAG: hypothetical protein RBT34_10665 [Anaerolineaceae bacterium]|jgi:hypothetical protein|nr:hypothetical protein [Anaerolineaceae bacterium]